MQNQDKHNHTLTITKPRTALVFIEFQQEWLAPDGLLYQKLIEDKPAFQAAVANAASVLQAARAQGWAVVHAGLDMRSDPHYRLFAGGQGVLGLRAAIPRAHTWTGDGAEFVAHFIPQGDEYIVRGRSGASVLKNSTLDAYLRNNRLDTVVFMGFATHVCVESSLREAHDMGLNAWVVSDGCAAFTVEQHAHFMQHILHHFGEGISSNDLVKRIQLEN